MILRAHYRLGGACFSLRQRLADARTDRRRQQVEFGIKVAQSGLWKEALVPLGAGGGDRSDLRGRVEQPRDRLRAEGKFDEAQKAYEKALELEPNNIVIRQNYDLFKEINDRTKRRGNR